MSHAARRLGLAVGVLAGLTIAVAQAQDSTTSTTVDIKNFEVVAVQGNQLVVKLPEGAKQIDVPEDFRFNIDGQQLSVHDLKPGMKGTATITTRTTVTPVVVTEVKNGTVVQPGGANVVVRTEDGIKMFTQGALDKRGVKILRDGQEVDLSQLHTGDKLTATIVTTKPPKVLTEKEVQARLAAPALAATKVAAAEPPAAIPTETTAAPAPAPPDTVVHRKKLPKTASGLPLLALVGALSMLTGLTLGVWRRRLER